MKIIIEFANDDYLEWGWQSKVKALIGCFIVIIAIGWWIS